MALENFGKTAEIIFNWGLDTGFWKLDSGFWMLDKKCKNDELLKD